MAVIRRKRRIMMISNTTMLWCDTDAKTNGKNSNWWQELISNLGLEFILNWWQELISNWWQELILNWWRELILNWWQQLILNWWQALFFNWWGKPQWRWPLAAWPGPAASSWFSRREFRAGLIGMTINDLQFIFLINHNTEGLFCLKFTFL